MSRSYIRSRFRFEHPDDIERFGGEWIIYDEHKIAELPARELIPWEIEMMTPLIDVMNGMRAGSVMGDLGATWLALKVRALAGGDQAPAFAEYNPFTMLLDWEPAPEDEGKEEAPDSQSPAPTPRLTVVLPTLPEVGSPG